MDRPWLDRGRDCQGNNAGQRSGGIIVTMIIGIVGAFIGGFLGNTIMGLGINGFTWQSLLLAIVGALILLWIYRMTTRGRTRVP